MEYNRTPTTKFSPDKLKPSPEKPLNIHTEDGKKLTQISRQLHKEGKAATRENISPLAYKMGVDPKIIECAVYDNEDFCDDQKTGFRTYEKLSSPDPVFLDDNPAIKIPHDVFPAAIGEMVEATSKATETPLELPGMLVLAVLATCTQQKFRVMAEQDYYEPLNLWTVAALEPGNRKSAVIKIMTQPLLNWEFEQVEGAKTEIRRLQEDRENKLARIKILRGNYAKAEAANREEIQNEIQKTTESLPEIPALPRVWVQDITPEKLGDVMAEQEGKKSRCSN